VNTGTWTPITSLTWTNLGHHVVRTYALIEYPETAESPAAPPRVTLKVWNGTPQVSEDFS